MGMDVWGRSPSAPQGKYFRANIWSWRPIQSLIAELCSDLIDRETLVRLGVNVGAGPTDQATCSAMANRFAQWMECHATGHQIDLGLRVTAEGRFVSEAELAENPTLETVTPYQTDDDHLREWVEFLRHCGGFEVW